MKSHPLLFSTPMVKALLTGTKTQTRRLVKGSALQWLDPDMFTPEFVALPENNFCPYGYPGDELWVRETVSVFKQADGTLQREKTKYKADEKWDGNKLIKWKPNIHMPKAACRIVLRILNIRIERLNNISEDDAMKEGVQEYADGTFKNYFKTKGLRDSDGVECLLAKGSFQSLWSSINGLSSWDENPWVWVIEFEVVSIKGWEAAV